MADITLGGDKISTNGELPKVGSDAPDFKLTTGELGDVSLEDFAGKQKLLNIVVSLDTGICADSAKRFSDEAGKHDDVVMLTISADLPFAQARACKDNKAEHVTTLSMMRSKNFAKDYGILIQDGPLAGVCARSIVILDKNNKVVYTQLVPEIQQEPDIDSALKALG